MEQILLSRNDAAIEKEFSALKSKAKQLMDFRAEILALGIATATLEDLVRVAESEIEPQVKTAMTPSGPVEVAGLKIKASAFADMLVLPDCTRAERFRPLITRISIAEFQMVDSVITAVAAAEEAITRNHSVFITPAQKEKYEVLKSLCDLLGTMGPGALADLDAMVQVTKDQAPPFRIYYKPNLQFIKQRF